MGFHHWVRSPVCASVNPNGDSSTHTSPHPNQPPSPPLSPRARTHAAHLPALACVLPSQLAPGRHAYHTHQPLNRTEARASAAVCCCSLPGHRTAEIPLYRARAAAPPGPLPWPPLPTPAPAAPLGPKYACASRPYLRPRQPPCVFLGLTCVSTEMLSVLRGKSECCVRRDGLY